MDCNVAREIADRSILSEDAPEVVAEALVHLDECSACQDYARSAAVFEGRLATAVRDVSVPVDLKERLLAAIGEPVPTTLIAPRPVHRRRRWVATVVACACSLAIAFGAWRYLENRRQPQPFDLAALRSAAAALLEKTGGQIDISTLNPFDGSFDLASLTEWSRTADLRGIEIDGRRGQDAAAAMIPIGNGVSGILLIVPAARVTDASQLATQAIVSYAPVAHAAWMSGEFVYVCVSTQNHLPELRRLVPAQTGAA